MHKDRNQIPFWDQEKLIENYDFKAENYVMKERKGTSFFMLSLDWNTNRLMLFNLHDKNYITHINMKETCLSSRSQQNHQVNTQTYSSSTQIRI